MAEVNSKNMYALLGNTSDQDSDREPDPPTKAIDATAPRVGKRNVSKEAPSAPAGTTVRGGKRGGFSGNEQAFRDRDAGRSSNRGKPVDDAAPRGGRGRGRGGRGRGGAPRDDRHSRTGVADNNKQGDQSWGAPTGDAEWKDEQAGAAIAHADEKEDDATPAANGEKEEAELEAQDSSISYADYLASKTKDISLGVLEARKPADNTKLAKKYAGAKEITHDDEEDAYIVGESQKARRERERKAKQLVDIDYSFKEPSREGGRGRGRGDGRPRGEGRGSFRGNPEGRGSFRGRGEGRGRGGPRGGAPRGGRGDASGPSVNDETAFPSLGGK